MVGVLVSDFQGWVIRGLVASSLLSLPDHSLWGSQLPCCEDTQAALGRAL